MVHYTALNITHATAQWEKNNTNNTNANGLKFSAGVYIIIVLSNITNVLSTEPIYKSRVCPHTFPECPVHRVSIPKVEYTEEWYTTKSKCDQGERHHGLEKICHGSCEGVMAQNRCFQQILEIQHPKMPILTGKLNPLPNLPNYSQNLSILKNPPPIFT